MALPQRVIDAVTRLRNSRAALNPDVSNPNREPPTGGNTQQAMHDVHGYLDELVRALRFANQYRANLPGNVCPLNICPLPVRFRENSSRTTYCSKNWRVFGYANQKAMQDSFLTIDEALGKFVPGSINYFLLLVNWNRDWKLTPACWLFNNRDVEILPNTTVQQHNQLTQQERLEIQNDHAAEHEEPHALVLKVSNIGEVHIYDPWFNPHMVTTGFWPDGGPFPRDICALRRIWHHSTIAQEFIRSLNNRHGVNERGLNMGPHPYNTLYGLFQGKEVSCCLSRIRDELWDDLDPAHPIRGDQEIYPGDPNVRLLKVV